MPWLDRFARRRDNPPEGSEPDPQTHEIIAERLKHHGEREEEEVMSAAPAPPDTAPKTQTADLPKPPAAGEVVTQQLPITAEHRALPGPATLEPAVAQPPAPAEEVPSAVAQPDPVDEVETADGSITTALVGIDVADGEDPAHVLELMASLEELAAVIFRRGDVTYPAGPAEMLLVCPERTPEEVRDAIGRLRRASAPLGIVRAALFSLQGDPLGSLPELQAALAVCRAARLELVDKTLFQD